MGTFHEPIEIWNPAKPGRKAALEALVDTGATYTLIPGKVLRRLGIRPARTLPFKIADGRIIRRKMGALLARVKGQQTHTWAVFGDDSADPLLGAITLEELALGVDSLHRTLVPITAYLVGFLPPRRKSRKKRA